MSEESPQPSTSKACLGNRLANVSKDDFDITLNIIDDEAEIARLELPVKEANTKGECDTSNTASSNDDRNAKIEFHCTACNMHEMVHYFGKSPPFVYGLQFLEDTFVMRDPFQPPPPRWKPKAEYFIAVGANCRHCQRTVCKDAECSFYYTRTYCLDCAERRIQDYPLEVQSKLRKQMSTRR